MRDHALREQGVERLARGFRQMPGLDHRPREEPRIQQVQDRVFDAADILVDVHPVGRILGHGRSRRVRRGKARVIPRGIDERVHRVGFPPRLPAAFGAGRPRPCRVPVQRVAGAVKADVARQQHRQLVLGFGNHAAGVAMHHRDRATPIALARDAPVAQAEFRHALAPACGFGMGDGGVDRGLAGLVGGAGKAAHIGHGVGLGGNKGLGRDQRVGLGLGHARAAKGGADRQPVFRREIMVALVVGGAAEQRPGPVIHQHEIRDPHRQFPRGVQRVAHPDSGVQPAFLGGLDRLFGGAALVELGRELGQRGVGFRKPPGQRMVGADRHERRPHQRVGAGRVNLDLREIGAVHRVEAELQPARAPDPVRLHQPHFFRPAFKPVDRLKQLLGVIRDAEEPLRQLAPFHRRVRAPALAVDHLFVGQHGHVHRIPVDHRGLAIDQPGVQHVQEQRLLLGDVIVVAGGELAAPVDAQAQRFQLPAHGGDVAIGPVARMPALFHRRVFRRHSKGVPAHRMQHRKPLRALITRHHVAHGIVAHMAHVDAPGRIGEHFQHVILGPFIAHGAETARLFPRVLPALFARGGIIGHGANSGQGKGRNAPRV